MRTAALENNIVSFTSDRHFFLGSFCFLAHRLFCSRLFDCLLRLKTCLHVKFVFSQVIVSVLLISFKCIDTALFPFPGICRTMIWAMNCPAMLVSLLFVMSFVLCKQKKKKILNVYVFYQHICIVHTFIFVLLSS